MMKGYVVLQKSINFLISIADKLKVSQSLKLNVLVDKSSRFHSHKSFITKIVLLI